MDKTSNKSKIGRYLMTSLFLFHHSVEFCFINRLKTRMFNPKTKQNYVYRQ